MSRLNVGNLFNENEDGAPVVSGISTFSSPHYFVPPSGSTAQRPQNPGEGMIRFNTDSGHLEYYSGELWVDVIVNNQDLGNQLVTNSAGGTGTRGIVGGQGSAPNNSNAIHYITMSTLGDSQDFGDLIAAGMKGCGMSSRTRLVFAGGYTGSGRQNVMEFVTMSSTGNSQDFGDQVAHGSSGRTKPAGLSNSTRGIMAGGQNSNSSPYFTNGISYITIASTGNDIDFGDANNSTASATGCGSPVRGVYQLGSNPRPIDYITFSTTGNAQDFGDLAANYGTPAGASNAVRGVLGGGNNNNNINFITIATTGNAQDFGDLTAPRFEIVGLGSPTRAVFAGGSQAPATPNIIDRIDYVEIMTTGNAVDFGNLTYTTGDGRQPQGGSNGHGGL